ncbi:NTP transferase domain-containing protein [Flavobacterium palustre]|uniref:NTP transferase domain-containing protein n=1 Tax=Flavobacterium palustre TaxID=1476463 RepID=UPI003612FC85
MHDNLIILAGGASSRMKKEAIVENLTKEEIAQANERSKGLIGVGPNGRPLMDYLLLNAKRAGYKNIYIIIGEQEIYLRLFMVIKTRIMIFMV